MTDVTNLMKLVEARDAAASAVAKAHDDLRDAEKDLEKNCPHPTTVLKHTKNEDEFGRSLGGTNWDVCTFCRKQLNERES